MQKYSVLMSVYYKEKAEWLDISIKSMISQTIMPEEFLIVKDGPLTEELDKVIEKYVTQYPSVFTIIALEKNIGLGPALSRGVIECRNELIIRMDSDDYSVPERSERLLNICEMNPEYGVIGSYEAEFDQSIENVIAIHKVPVESNEIYDFMKRRCALLHPTVLYRRSVILESGNYMNIHLYEDYDLFMRIVLEKKVKCYNIPQSLYYIRINDEFFRRRGGIEYMKTVLAFKWNQYKCGNFRLLDFVISGGGQAVVCLMPNKLRKWVYLKFLRG